MSWVAEQPTIKAMLAETLGPPLSTKARLLSSPTMSHYLPSESEREHFCKLPGALSRSLHRVREGSRWQCHCGQVWTWRA